jgi:CheY-like chemotaxis protein
MATHILTAGEEIVLAGEVRLIVLAVTEDQVVLGISRPAGADEPDLPGWARRCRPPSLPSPAVTWQRSRRPSLPWPATTTEPTVGRPVGVLLVEGNTLVLDTLLRWLGHHGFTVWPAPGAAAALELLRDGAAIDLALVEVRTPDRDGLATLAALRALRPGLVCCLLGGNIDEQERERLLAAGAARVLDKPLLRGLAETLRGPLPGRQAANWATPTMPSGPAPWSRTSAAPRPTGVAPVVLRTGQTRAVRPGGSGRLPARPVPAPGPRRQTCSKGKKTPGAPSHRPRERTPDGLSARPPAHPFPPSRETARAMNSARSLLVLIADDHPDTTESLALVLRLWGHQTLEAHDGPAALEAAVSGRPDVALLDIGLPRLNGWEVGRRIRERLQADTPVLLALTGHAREEDRRHSREAGFDLHLVKPVDLEQLLALLTEVAELPPDRG